MNYESENENAERFLERIEKYIKEETAKALE
jgi:hypothetical protein